MTGIKGLDDYIMGIHDHNAPFNQVEWIEQYEHVLEHCNWIADEFCDDDEIYDLLGNAMDEIANQFTTPYNYYNKKSWHHIIKDNAKEMAEKLKEFCIFFLNMPDAHLGKFKITKGGLKSNWYNCQSCSFNKTYANRLEAHKAHKEFIQKQKQIRERLKKLVTL